MFTDVKGLPLQVSAEEIQGYCVNALVVFGIVESLKSGKLILVKDIG